GRWRRAGTRSPTAVGRSPDGGRTSTPTRRSAPPTGVRTARPRTSCASPRRSATTSCSAPSSVPPSALRRSGTSSARTPRTARSGSATAPRWPSGPTARSRPGRRTASTPEPPPSSSTSPRPTSPSPWSPTSRTVSGRPGGSPARPSTTPAPRWCEAGAEVTTYVATLALPTRFLRRVAEDHPICRDFCDAWDSAGGDVDQLGGADGHLADLLAVEGGDDRGVGQGEPLELVLGNVGGDLQPRLDLALHLDDRGDGVVGEQGGVDRGPPDAGDGGLVAQALP